MPLTPMETILVVDDDSMVRRYVTSALMGAGYQVYDALGGNRGFACFMEHAEEIDLVFTDVMMPEVSGPEMVERILRYRPEVKILFMTGYHALEDPSAWSATCGVLWKPFTREAMLSSVEGCLRDGRGERKCPA
jgi:two-component system cell cycle sensor histidine kinase/response regulator CckA